jgi:nicotinate-nucleotide adenylyltransferase
MNNKITVILGGTFDPIHNGHIKIAQHLAQYNVINTIKLTPCNIPALKNKPQTSAQHRLAMLEIALKKLNKTQIETCEIDREGISYMSETLKFLKQTTNDSLALAVGVDAFNQLNKWHNWQEILETAHIIIAPRSGNKITTETWAQEILNNTCNIEQLQMHENGKTVVLDMPLTPVSSSRIREESNNHIPPEGVPEDVKQYIKNHNLYI